jgi:hypothetical protein
MWSELEQPGPRRATGEADHAAAEIATAVPRCTTAPGRIYRA